jgi:hypothetical protein
MCCRVFPLPILDKPENQWCQFLSASGCALHDHGQPEVCRQYACYWLEHEELPDAYRPDRIEMVVTECGSLSLSGQVLPVFVLNQSRPGACQGPGARALIDGMTLAGGVLLVIYGPDMHLVYDRGRYAPLSEAEIEAAFRYERSQDAEELKSLGAVTEDFRALTRAEAEANGRCPGGNGSPEV